MAQPIKGGNFPGNVPSLPQNYGAEPTLLYQRPSRLSNPNDSILRMKRPSETFRTAFSEGSVYSVWLFYIHSAVKIRPFSSFPLGGSHS